MDFDSCETVFLSPFFLIRSDAFLYASTRSLMFNPPRASLARYIEKDVVAFHFTANELRTMMMRHRKAKPGPCSFHLSCSHNVSRIKLLISIPLLPRSLPSSFPFQNFNPRRLNKKKQASDWNDGRRESFVREKKSLILSAFPRGEIRFKAKGREGN